MADSDAEIASALELVTTLQKAVKDFNRSSTVKELRALITRLEALPYIENELAIIAARLTRRLSVDPDKTPLPSKSQQLKVNVRKT